MMQRVYSIFDSKSLIYNQPFFSPTNGSAVRTLADMANDPKSMVGRHPADFVLYCIGHYNDQDGLMTPYSPLEHVVDAVALLRIEKQLPLLTPRPNGQAVDARLGEE